MWLNNILLHHSYQVMCDAFDKYLETFRRSVVFVEDKSIVQLAERVLPLIMQIRNLAKVLSIHPDGKFSFFLCIFLML